MVGETGAPGGNCRKKREKKLHNHHWKVLPQPGIKPGPSCCELSVLTFTAAVLAPVLPEHSLSKSQKFAMFCKFWWYSRSKSVWVNHCHSFCTSSVNTVHIYVTTHSMSWSKICELVQTVNRRLLLHSHDKLLSLQHLSKHTLLIMTE